jgi:hypothetical protein
LFIYMSLNLHSALRGWPSFNRPPTWFPHTLVLSYNKFSWLLAMFLYPNLNLYSNLMAVESKIPYTIPFFALYVQCHWLINLPDPKPNISLNNFECKYIFSSICGLITPRLQPLRLAWKCENNSLLLSTSTSSHMVLSIDFIHLLRHCLLCL